MNSYDGLFIITTQGQEENFSEVIEQIEAELRAQNCVIESVQKLDKRDFERPNNKHSSGFYVNIRFQAEAETIAELRSKFKFNAAIYRQFYVKRNDIAAPAPTT